MPSILSLAKEPTQFAGPVISTQENLPDMIPVEMCYLGWSESLELLKLLVEPKIPDGA